MLEALTREKLRDKLGVISDESGAPAIAPVAGAVRNVVQAWRFPARQRVSGYLHRQLVAAGYAEESVRTRVADVIDSLIDIGDLTIAQLDGKRCLVSSRGSFVKICENEHAVLGMTEGVNESSESWRYARAVSAAPDDASVIDFHEWIGSAAFRRHLTRRLAGSDDGTIREFWTALTSALRNEGSSIDRVQVRAVIAPPNSQNSFFGRHNVPAPSGRWSRISPTALGALFAPVGIQTNGTRSL